MLREFWNWILQYLPAFSETVEVPEQSSTLPLLNPKLLTRFNMERFGHNRVSLSAAGINEEEMDDLCDYFTCQDPVIREISETSTPASPSDLPQLFIGNPKELLDSARRPLDPRILTTMETIHLYLNSRHKERLSQQVQTPCKNHRG